MIAIVDTGLANIASLRFAIERLGVTPVVSADAATLAQADKLFLPGVGAAAPAMRGLKERGLVDFLREFERPMLGICLGMQLLCASSSEGQGAECLGKLSPIIRPLKNGEAPLPHMGWNSLSRVAAHPLFSGIPAGTAFYFVHSYAAPLSEATLAECEYGETFSAALGSGNALGVQFHPERSGAAGAQLIENFLQWEGV